MNNDIRLIEIIADHLNTILARVGLTAARIEGMTQDGSVVTLFGKKRSFIVKKALTPGRIMFLEKELAESNGILFTDYLSTTIAEMLQQRKIEYADSAGNVFLLHKKSIILIQNCAKPAKVEALAEHGRAWTIAGLKVLFLFLTEPDALQWNYRKIGEYAGVSLGSVKYVLADLMHQRILVRVNDVLCFSDFISALEKWSGLYKQKLLSKIDIRKYSGSIPNMLNNEPLTFSGESFAKRNNILKSNRELLWRNGNINAFIAKNRLHPDEHGNIEIRDAFWPPIRNFGNKSPYPLIYADLLAENDGRCLEAAGIILERYLRAKNANT